MNRRAGLAAFDKDISDARFKSLGQDIVKQQYDELLAQFETFQQALAAFAQSHAEEIRADPQFRQQFATMCTAIGIDPLLSTALPPASVHTGLTTGSARLDKTVRAVVKDKKLVGGKAWQDALGIADIYNELAVQVIEHCRRSRASDGGMIAATDLTAKLNARRAKFGGVAISEDDIERAVARLKVLESGFEVIQVGSRRMVRSVPRELDGDEATVLETCEIVGLVSRSMLVLNLGWDTGRAAQVLDDMVGAGLLWVDGQGREVEYWQPPSVGAS
ncbi:ESCRT II complex subunit Dot2 [Savitreella phatthalungensis]